MSFRGRREILFSFEFRSSSRLGNRLFETEQEMDLRPGLDEVVDRIICQHVEEGVERLAQRGIQPTAIDQRAIGSIVVEAFGHRETVFSDAYDIEQGDL